MFFLNFRYYKAASKRPALSYFAYGGRMAVWQWFAHRAVLTLNQLPQWVSGSRISPSRLVYDSPA